MRSLFTTSYEQTTRNNVVVDIHVQHDHQPFSVEVFQRLIKNCHYFADIGAGSGYYCQVAQQLRPNIRVIAFESLPEKIALLKKSLRVNKTNNSFTTKLEKLSELLKDSKKIFFRINAVCHEIEVLEKVGEKLVKLPPLLIVFDPSGQARGGTSPSLLLKRLSKLGYLVYFLNETSYEYWQYETGKTEGWHAFTELSGPCNILCVAPTEKDTLRVIFDDLLISKYVGATTLTNKAFDTFLQKTKLTTQRKISQCRRKKYAVDLKMTEIASSDYFKAWQLFNNLVRRVVK